ncbi:hypothetical protein [Pseudomonas monsensis]
MRITEESVLEQSRLRAMYRGENEVMAAASALEALNAIKESLKGDEYQAALENLYAEYTKS